MTKTLPQTTSDRSSLVLHWAVPVPVPVKLAENLICL